MLIFMGELRLPSFYKHYIRNLSKMKLSTFHKNNPITLKSQACFFLWVACIGIIPPMAEASKKPFFPLSAECEEYCSKKGERVDVPDSAMENQCECYPV